MKNPELSVRKFQFFIHTISDLKPKFKEKIRVAFGDYLVLYLVNLESIDLTYFPKYKNFFVKYKNFRADKTLDINLVFNL